MELSCDEVLLDPFPQRPSELILVARPDLVNTAEEGLPLLVVATPHQVLVAHPRGVKEHIAWKREQGKLEVRVSGEDERDSSQENRLPVGSSCRRR